MKKNIIANFIGRFWGLLSNFLFIPLYIKFLGFDSYSIISFTLVLASLMALLDVGLTASLSRELARKDNSNEDKINIFGTLESLYFILSFVCIISLFFGSNLIATNWLSLNPLQASNVTYYIKIISFDIGFQLILRFYLGGLIGLEKQVLANIYQVLWGFLRNGFVLLIVYYIPNLDLFFIWQALISILFAVIIRFSLNKVLFNSNVLKIKLSFKKEIFKKIYQFAGGMLFISLIASLNTQMDKLAISKLLPVEYLGNYTIALSLAMGIYIFVNPISVALLPRFTSLYSLGNKTEATSLFIKINSIVSVIVFTVLANMSLFSVELIWIWTGNLELAKSLKILLPVMSFAYAFLALQVIPFNIAIANGNTNINIKLGIISLCITLPGFWILTLHYGIIGTAALFCGVQVISMFVYLYFINLKYLNIGNFTFYCLKNVLIPLIISFTASFLFTSPPDYVIGNKFFLTIWIFIASLFTFIILLIFSFPVKEIKDLILNKQK